MLRNDTPLTPKEATIYVAYLARILANMPVFDEESVYKAMSLAGLPSDLADRTYKFTQIAWGRFLLEPSEILPDMGITLSGEYLCCDAHGNIIESGLLADEPLFIAARQVLRRYIGAKACLEFASCSADVQALNNLLHSDPNADPKKMVLGPACLFMEIPTEEGLKKGCEIIAQYLKARRASKAQTEETPQKASKPWWRFWES